MRSFVATLTATAAGLALATSVAQPASAAPAPVAAEQVCTAQGGRFQAGGAGYVCIGDFTPGQLTAAAAICINANRGTFLPPTDFTHAYVCYRG